MRSATTQFLFPLRGTRANMFVVSHMHTRLQSRTGSCFFVFSAYAQQPPHKYQTRLKSVKHFLEEKSLTVSLLCFIVKSQIVSYLVPLILHSGSGINSFFGRVNQLTWLPSVLRVDKTPKNKKKCDLDGQRVR